MSKPTVIIGFAEALSAPEVAWSLVDAGFNVIAFARKGRSAALRHSRHVVCHEIVAPEADLQTSLAELNSLLTRLEAQAQDGPRLLLPLDDKAVWLASRAQLRDRWILAGPRGSQSELALNKCIQMQQARDAGFNVPNTAFTKTKGDVLRFVAGEQFPIILKPAECIPVRDGKLYDCRKWTCANQDELVQALEQWNEAVPLLVQPFVAGTGEGIFGLATSEGVRAWSGHRRLRMMNPEGSGSSACIAQEVSDDLKQSAEQLIRRANWQGLFMIELLRDQSGKVWFMELNGRPWGSMALCRRQGFEYPAWHAQLALDQNSAAGTAAPPVTHVVCRHAGREFMHLLFVLRGPKSKAFRGWPSFWNSLLGVAHIRRRDGLYNWRRDDPKVFAADFYSTVKSNVFKSKH